MSLELAFTCPFPALWQKDLHLALHFDLILDNGFNFLLVSAFGNIGRHDVVMSRLGGNKPFNGRLFRLCVDARWGMDAIRVKNTGASGDWPTGRDTGTAAASIAVATTTAATVLTGTTLTGTSSATTTSTNTSLLHYYCCLLLLLVLLLLLIPVLPVVLLLKCVCLFLLWFSFWLFYPVGI